MSEQDLAQVNVVANVLHPDFFEDEEVFRDRLFTYPDGCFVLERENEIQGYAISHPWKRDSVPVLNSVFGTLPESSDVYYIHDIALLPQARSGGQASRVVGMMVAHAERCNFRQMALVAVNNSQAFWERQGFRPVTVVALTEKLKTYSDDAQYMVRKG